MMAVCTTLAACGQGSGGSGPAAVVDGDTTIAPVVPVDPSYLAPGTVLSSPSNPEPGATPVTVTYYSKTKTSAPISSWSTKTFTATGSCVNYNSYIFCWDDGIKTLQWTSNGHTYGPYTYTYWGIKGTLGSCYGGCTGDLMTQPRVLSNSLIAQLNISANDTGNTVNGVFTTGTPKTVNCSLLNGVLNCVDFVLNMNQTPL